MSVWCGVGDSRAKDLTMESEGSLNCFLIMVGRKASEVFSIFSIFSEKVRHISVQDQRDMLTPGKDLL